MWTKSRFANWETEGAVRDRVDKALAEGEQRRLAKAARAGQDRHLVGRMRTTFKAGLAWLASRAKAERVPAQSTIEPASDPSSKPLHRRPAPGS